jgi:hypothetical protein
MAESSSVEESHSSERNRIIKGYYLSENSRAILIKIYNGISFWVPKHCIDSHFSKKGSLLQEFTIENFILKQIGFNFDKI